MADTSLAPLAPTLAPTTRYPRPICYVAADLRSILLVGIVVTNPRADLAPTILVNFRADQYAANVPSWKREKLKRLKADKADRNRPMDAGDGGDGGEPASNRREPVSTTCHLLTSEVWAQIRQGVNQLEADHAAGRVDDATWETARQRYGDIDLAVMEGGLVD